MKTQNALPRLLFSAYAVCGMLAVALPASAATVTFGTGLNQFTMEFVDVGNTTNLDDTSPAGYGGVSYAYQMGTYEVSRGMVDKANAPVVAGGGNLGLTLADMTSSGGNGVDRPATGISWNEAARFVNWLNTSQGFQAAYNFQTGGPNDNISLWSSGDAWQLDGENLYRHKDAHYFLPSEDEWYKTAYNDGSASTYFDYATGSDTAPTAVPIGTTPGTAVYEQDFATGPADIMSAGGLSPYGTMAQNGNVWEWAESGFTAPNDTAAESRVLRGGYWNFSSGLLRSSLRGNFSPSDGASPSDFALQLFLSPPQ
jgi:formylglycine-generating enzyme